MTVGLLGSTSPAAATETTLYTCRGGLTSLIGSVVICNATAASVTVRLALAAGGVATGPGSHIIYDHALPAYDSIEWSPSNGGTALSGQDTLRCYASAVGVAFNVFGVEELLG